MKFYEYMEKNNIIFYEEEEEPIPAGDEEDPEKILQDKIVKKMDEIGALAVKELNKLIETKADILISKIQKIGVDEVLLDFITQAFIPTLKDPDDKLFVTVNLDDFVTYLSEKFSERLIDGVNPKKDAPKKKDEKDKEEK